jgi:hypothetical protein
MTVITVPKRIGYAGGNLKGLEKVLVDIAAAIDQGDFSNVTATSSEINALHEAGAIKADFVKLHAIASTAAAVDAAVTAASPATFSVTATAVEIAAGKVVVPAVAGKQFIVQDAWMQAIGGAAAGSTLIRLVEETSNAVVMSHVVADMTENTWVGKTGGTVVITALGSPLVANKAVQIDKTGNALTGATSVRAVVVGFYV